MIKIKIWGNNGKHEKNEKQVHSSKTRLYKKTPTIYSVISCKNHLTYVNGIDKTIFFE